MYSSDCSFLVSELIPTQKPEKIELMNPSKRIVYLKTLLIFMLYTHIRIVLTRDLVIIRQTYALNTSSL